MTNVILFENFKRFHVVRWGHYIASVISLIRVSKFEHMSLIKTTLEGMIGAHKHTAIGINYFPAPHVSVDQLTKFSLSLLLKSDLKKKL